MNTIRNETIDWGLSYGLTDRVMNRLAELGITTMGQLMHLTYREMKLMKGIGQQARTEIQKVQNHAKDQGAEPEPVAVETAPPGVEKRVNTEHAPAVLEEPMIDVDAIKAVAKQLDETDIPEGHRMAYNAVTGDVIGPFKYSHLSLGARIEQVRIARGYIQRTKTTEGAQFKSAVKYDVLMRLVRPLMVDWGIRWKPVATKVLHHERFERNNKVWFTELLEITVRFKRTEDPDAFNYASPEPKPDYEDVVVVVRGLDFQDKGLAKAYTEADKRSLIRLLNLEYGDDPDFTRLDLAPDVPKKNQECIDQIRELLEKDPEIEDVDAHLKALAVEHGRKISRRIVNEYALPLPMLEAIRNKLQDASAAKLDAEMDATDVAPKISEAELDKVKAVVTAVRQARIAAESPPKISEAEQAQMDEMRGAAADPPEATPAAVAIAKAHEPDPAPEPVTEPLPPAETQLDKEVAQADAADEANDLAVGEQDYLDLGEVEFQHHSQVKNPFA